jgi:deoxycytidine triphosphate deaminase
VAPFGSVTSDLRFDPDAYLCHYTRAETAFEHIIPSGKLRMNPYAQMRDPFENRHPHLSVPNGKLWQDEARRRLWLQVVNTTGWLRSRVRLLSLTQGDYRPGNEHELPFRMPWSRARLWEQYADNHEGVCLVFDREAMLKTFREELAERVFWEGPVDYAVAGFSSSEGARLDLSNFRDAELEADVERHVSDHFRDFFFIKTEEWASEFEYRVVLGEGFDISVRKGLGFHPTPHDVAFGDSLRYVLVNVERFPRWKLLGASRVAAESTAELLPMTWEGGRPLPGEFG